MTIEERTTSASTPEAIRAELDEAWREMDYHGITCTCCARYVQGDDLRRWLVRSALYATDRYRPSEGYRGVSECRIDRLADDLAEQALWAARNAITVGAIAALAGRIEREELPV